MEALKEGFQINTMRMSDFENDKVSWEEKNWNFKEDAHTENMPKEILYTKKIKRGISFSSKEKINNLTLEQITYFNGKELAKLNFEFGFIIPGTTNDYEHIVDMGDDPTKLPQNFHEQFSGNIKMETRFLSDGVPFYSKTILIYYI